MAKIDTPLDKRKCANCASSTTYLRKRKDNGPVWFNIDGKPWCKNCYFKVFEYPKKKIKWQYNHSHRRIYFKIGPKFMKENPRLGFCNICKKKVGDKYVNRFGMEKVLTGTHIHHIKYHDDDPLRDTMELCEQCHGKISKKQLDIILVS